MLRPDLRDPAAYPDGEHCQTEEPVEVDDAQGVTGEVLPVYGPIEEGRKSVILLNFAFEYRAKVVVSGVERVRGEINLIKLLI